GCAAAARPARGTTSLSPPARRQASCALRWPRTRSRPAEVRLGAGEPLLGELLGRDVAVGQLLAEALELDLDDAVALAGQRGVGGDALRDVVLVADDLVVDRALLDLHGVALLRDGGDALRGAEDLAHLGVVDEEVDERGGGVGLLRGGRRRQQHRRLPELRRAL